MNLGDVFYWRTDQVIGRETRSKFHVFICPPDAIDEHTFLLINKISWGHDLEIKKSEYSFLEYDSFVGCNGVVCYDDKKLAAFDKNPVGRLSNAHLQGLFNILADPKAMERAQAKRLCAALKAAF